MVMEYESACDRDPSQNETGGVEESRLFIDAYNRRWTDKVTGTIDRGVDFRCQLFIYEAQDDNGQERPGDGGTDNKQQGQPSL